jgi:26S proteasome regulatory subunit N2
MQDVKKEGDIEMKSEEVPSVRQGDISPINESISNLPEGQSSEIRTPNKRKEPTFESLPNFSRVTPAQFQHVVFPPSSRYQPVRPVSAREPVIKAGKGVAGAQKAPQPEKYAGGGGILLLVDERPGEPQEFIELSTVAPPASQVAPATTTGARSERNIALDPNGPEAEMPEPFEVSCGLFCRSEIWGLINTKSTRLIAMTHDKVIYYDSLITFFNLQENVSVTSVTR